MKTVIIWIFINSPRLEVKEAGNVREIETGQVTMAPGMLIEANTIYMGGVPPTIATPQQDVPTDKPLIGGISNLTFNGQ